MRPIRTSLAILLVSLPVSGVDPQKPALDGGKSYAEIRVLDDETDRGVPLAELETVNGFTFVTDNAGRVASIKCSAILRRSPRNFTRLPATP